MDLRILFLVVVVFACVIAAPTPRDEDRQYISSILESVPEKDRKQFIIHQLYKGYVLKHPNFVTTPIPVETTLKLFDLFLKNYIIPEPEDIEVFSQICFPSGECVDTDDPGVYP